MVLLGDRHENDGYREHASGQTTRVLYLEGEVIASTAHEPTTSRKQHPVSAALHTLEKHVQPLLAFWTKFNNDWAWNNAAGLAFNLILAVFPIVITLLSRLGFFLRTLDPGAYQTTLDKITSVSSALREAKPIVMAAFQQVRKDAGLLGALAVVLALFNGSRFFIFMEGCLDIIYHVRCNGYLEYPFEKVTSSSFPPISILAEHAQGSHAGDVSEVFQQYLH